MNITQTKIYPYIENRPDLCRLSYFDAGETVLRGTDRRDYVWFIVKGIVEVLADTGDDKTQPLHFDFLGEDCFVGEPALPSLFFPFGRYVTFTPCELLRVPVSLVDEIFENDPELRCHYLELFSMRSFSLCLDLAASKLFSQRQLLAAHILEEADSSVCFFNVVDACAAANTSKRHLYNLIRGLESDGIITYKKPKTIFINDEAALRSISKPVLDFFGSEM